MMEIKTNNKPPFILSNIIGIQGKNGKSPYIGDNGNWFTWNEQNEEYDTGVPASGGSGEGVALGLDATLTDPNKAAQAKAVGDALKAINESIENEFSWEYDENEDIVLLSPEDWAQVQQLIESGGTGGGGVTPNLQIGEVETLEAGQNATASITGTPENPLLNLGIPKGETGADGPGISGTINYGTYIKDAYAYGFRTGYANRALNDSKMEEFLAEADNSWKRSLHFGTGEWWFTKGFSIPRGRLVNIYGDVIPTRDTRQTTLCFDPAGDWDCAIDATNGGSMTLENITLCAGDATRGYCYNINFYRTLAEDERTDRDDLFVESGTDLATGVKRTALRVGGSTMTNNVIIQYFWTALDILTGNMSAANVTAMRCHTALRTQNDAYCSMIRADNCYTAWENWNVGNHVGSLRGDSVVHMIEASKGRFSIDETLDGDFCVGSLVVLGNPGGSTTIEGFTVQNAVSRCCARYAYPKTREYTMPTGVTQDCAWITVLPNTIVNGGYINFTNAQSITPSANWNYATPMPELCCGSGAKINNMQIVTQRKEWADVTPSNLNDKYIRGLDGTIIVDHGTDKLKIVRSGDQAIIISAFAGGSGDSSSTGGSTNEGTSEDFGRRWRNITSQLINVSDSATEAQKKSAGDNNSAVLNNILSNIGPGWNTNNLDIFIGSGTWYFSQPIKITSSQGVTISGSSDNFPGSMPTRLVFEWLTEGQAAIEAKQCTISNLTVMGSSSAYNLSIARGTDGDSGGNDPFPIITETVGVANTIGIKINSGFSRLNNIVVKNFYTGVYAGTGNNVISSIYTTNCHYGVQTLNDIYIGDLHAWQTLVCVYDTGTLAHYGSLRGDSIGVVLHSTKGGFYADQIDGDYCASCLVQIGTDKAAGENSYIGGFYIGSLIGRSCEYNAYLANTKYNMNNITIDSSKPYNSSSFAMVHIAKGAIVQGGTIVYSRSTTGGAEDMSQAYDREDPTAYRYPMAELYIDSNASANLNILTANNEWDGQDTLADIDARHIKILGGTYAGSSSIMVDTLWDRYKITKTGAGPTTITSLTHGTYETSISPRTTTTATASLSKANYFWAYTSGKVVGTSFSGTTPTALYCIPTPITINEGDTFQATIYDHKSIRYRVAIITDANDNVLWVANSHRAFTKNGTEQAYGYVDVNVTAPKGAAKLYLNTPSSSTTHRTVSYKLTSA